MKRKEIKITITLAGKDEGGQSLVFSGSHNQMSAVGLRIYCDIMCGFGAVAPTAQIRVYGLALEKMTKLLRVRWNTLGALMNSVKIDAGEQGETLHTEFEGNITFAYPDFANAPDVALMIEAQTAYIHSKKAANPSVYKGAVNVSKVVEDIAKDMGFQFENNGVSIMTDNVSLNDVNLEKLRRLSSAYGFDLYFDAGVVVIAPKGGERKMSSPIITPTSGLVGYPVPDIRGVTFKCLYDPLLRFGGPCKISDSVVDACNGDWRIYGIRKSIESNQPNGNWFCEVAATWKDSKDATIK